MDFIKLINQYNSTYDIFKINFIKFMILIETIIFI